MFLAFLFVFVILGFFLFVFYGEVTVKCPRAREREAAQHLEERERENGGEKKKRVGPITVINWDPQELSLDLNPV